MRWIQSTILDSGVRLQQGRSPILSNIFTGFENSAEGSAEEPIPRYRGEFCSNLSQALPQGYDKMRLLLGG